MFSPISHPASAAKHLISVMLGLSVVAAAELSCAPNAAAADAKPDPCAVVAPADIQSALGAAPAGEGKRDNMGMVDSCEWSMPNGARLHLTFYATPVGSPRVSSKSPSDKAYEEIGGLGKEAVYKDTATPPIIPVSDVVEVATEQQHFDVQYVDTGTQSGGHNKDRLIALARTILARLH